MEKIICSKCNKNEAEYFHVTQNFVCADCLPFCHSYLVDKYIIDNGEVKAVPMELDIYRAKDILYAIIGCWNGNLERQYKILLKSFTPTQIARAVEYRTYAVGDKSITHKHNLGAMKFYINTSDVFYNEMHQHIKEQMTQLASIQTKTRVIKRRK